MYHCKLTPYEGAAEYIFVSYAHKDAELVLPILDALAERGYRIWYDEGITPGSEWPEYIAERLNSSSLVLAFLSPASLDSDNCRREITFALSKKINLLAIMLEPTKLTLGMEMQLASHQCVLRYKYPSFSQFIEKICSMPELENCCHIARGKHMRSVNEEHLERKSVPAVYDAPAVQPASFSTKKKSPQKAAAKNKTEGTVLLVLGIVIALALVSAVAVLFSLERQDAPPLPSFVTAPEAPLVSASPIPSSPVPTSIPISTEEPLSAQTLTPIVTQAPQTGLPEETPYVYVPIPESSLTPELAPISSSDVPAATPFQNPPLPTPGEEIYIPSIEITPEPNPLPTDSEVGSMEQIILEEASAQ